MGRKGKEWERVRRSLKREFLARGITTCEIGLPGCLRDNFLGFAHSKKRRNIKGEKELREVVLACSLCHMAIEEMTESRMSEIVRSIIHQRKP